MTAYSSQNPNYGKTGSSQFRGPSGYMTGQVEGLSPGGRALYDQFHEGSSEGIGAGLKHLTGLASGDESAFEEMERPATRRFGEQQAQLASRFSGMGIGARRSSGFQNASGSHARDFVQDMQSKRMDIRNNAINQLLGIGKHLLGTQDTKHYMVEEGPSGFEQFLSAAAPLAGAGLGYAVGGPTGALAGAQLGGGISSSLSGRPSQQYSGWGGPQA